MVTIRFCSLRFVEIISKSCTTVCVVKNKSEYMPRTMLYLMQPFIHYQPNLTPLQVDTNMALFTSYRPTNVPVLFIKRPPISQTGTQWTKKWVSSLQQFHLFADLSGENDVINNYSRVLWRTDICYIYIYMYIYIIYMPAFCTASIFDEIMAYFKPL